MGRLLRRCGWLTVFVGILGFSALVVHQDQWWTLSAVRPGERQPPPQPATPAAAVSAPAPAAQHSQPKLHGAHGAPSTVTVGTVNLWNTMYMWNVRKLRLAELIEELGVDIVALEEVRDYEYEVAAVTGHTPGQPLPRQRSMQLKELQHLLPRHKYSFFVPSTTPFYLTPKPTAAPPSSFPFVKTLPQLGVLAAGSSKCVNMTLGKLRYSVCGGVAEQYAVEWDEAFRLGAYKRQHRLDESTGTHRLNFGGGQLCKPSQPDLPRTAVMIAHCATEERLVWAKEVATCRYELLYVSPLLCPSSLPAHGRPPVPAVPRALRPKPKRKNLPPLPDYTEGLAILSTFPIVGRNHTVFRPSLPTDKEIDLNKRIGVHVHVQLPADADHAPLGVDLFVTHLTYAKELQCRNMFDLRQFVQQATAPSSGTDNTAHSLQVVLGDLNTYQDYAQPLDIFLRAQGVTPPHACHSEWRAEHFAPQFTDAWTALHRAGGPQRCKGFTFSNMPQPGLQSRPDRILVAQPQPQSVSTSAATGTSNSMLSRDGAGWTITNVTTVGDGRAYKQRFLYALLCARLAVVLPRMRVDQSSVGVRPSCVSVLPFTGQAPVKGKLKFGNCGWWCAPHGVCRCGVCVAKPDYQSPLANRRQLPPPHTDQEKQIKQLFKRDLQRFKDVLSRPSTVCVATGGDSKTVLDVVFGVLNEELFPSDHLVLSATFKYQPR